MTSDAPNWWERLPLKFHELALIGAILAVFLITAALDSNHTYFTNFERSAVIIVRNAALLGMIALGSAVVIIAGGIDLSAGSMVATSATVCALTMVLFTDPGDRTLASTSGLGIFCGIAAAILSGLLVGTLHTWLITAIRLPPFVATLATLVGMRSFAQALCEFVTKVHWGSSYKQVYVTHDFFKYLKDHYWISVLVFLALALVTWVLLSLTVLGRHTHALGGNEQAARLSGIRTENIKWFAYCFGALCASIAGIFEMADSSVAQPVTQARGYELNAIAAAVVGGCSLQGGIGTVPGVVLGALFLRLVIDAVAKIIKVNADVYEGMIVGIVVALAVTFTQFRQLVAGGQEFFAGARGWVAIATLGIVAALLAMMMGRDAAFLQGHYVGAGLAVGLVVVVALGAIKWIESQRAAQE